MRSASLILEYVIDSFTVCCSALLTSASNETPIALVMASKSDLAPVFLVYCFNAPKVSCPNLPSAPYLGS